MAETEGNISTSFWDDIPSYHEYSDNFSEPDPRTVPCTQSEVGAFARFFCPAVFSLAFVVGLVGNGSVLVILGKHRCPWLFADCFLFQLAMADLLLVLILPFRAAQFAQSWVFGEFLCKLLSALSTMNSYSTIFLMACLSVERYLVIVRGIQLHHRWKLHHTYVASAGLWVLCFGLSVPELHFHTVTYGHVAGASVCHLDFSAQGAGSWHLGLRFTSFSLGFLLPVLVMAFCYCQVVARLYQAHLFCKYSALSLLLVILGLFVLCWAPFHGFLLVDSLQRLGHLDRDCAREKVLDFGLLFTESLGMFHCCLNPLVYAVIGGKFRRELFRLFHWWDRSKEHDLRTCSQEHSQATENSTAQGLNYSVMI
ncbi:C-X-C chemokine receptor type 3-2-like [Hemicordylus capensis]|uniref:C-X-C chemokine receptor type 3-2-like n=1 Tax=Hemicordylus capensis TaxID=884348 RepID=UPI0023038E01|nr:C-X-C chemokine receptor type 3-2-like [Hemicordylus capensis]